MKLFNACEFLLNDAPVFTTKLHKLALPPINHLLTVQYAQILDPILEFQDYSVKPLSLLYHKMICCTLKHCMISGDPAIRQRLANRPTRASTPREFAAIHGIRVAVRTIHS